MIDVRPFETVGAFQTDWLDARHHFSFGGYHDPARMGWGALRVWNDDAIQPRTGFPPHPHQEMEIITFVREGAITHEDSLGNRGRTEAGDVQVMSAGSGIRHAEYNAEDTLTRIFQIWILPDARGGAPYWNQRGFPKAARAGRLDVLASGKPGDDGALPIRADARVLGATLKSGETAVYDLAPARHAYLVPSKGAVSVNATRLEARQGAAIKAVDWIEITAETDAEIVMTDTR